MHISYGVMPAGQLNKERERVLCAVITVPLACKLMQALGSKVLTLKSCLAETAPVRGGSNARNACTLPRAYPRTVFL
jgi:hypothetical protein